MNKVIIFLAGLGIGGGVTWYFTREYYRRVADTEIESVLNRERYKKEEESEEPSAEDKHTYTELTRNYSKPSVMDYAARYSSTKEEEVEGTLATQHPEDDDETAPYVISPDEFGEIADYDQISLTYYADGYLVEGDNVIDNVDEVVGPDALDSFGMYEEDSVFVRNDKYGADYEILLSEMNFRE